MAPRPFCWPRRESRVWARTRCVAVSAGGPPGALGKDAFAVTALAFARRDCGDGRRPSSSLAAQPRPELARLCTARRLLDARPASASSTGWKHEASGCRSEPGRRSGAVAGTSESSGARAAPATHRRRPKCAVFLARGEERKLAELIREPGRRAIRRSVRHPQGHVTGEPGPGPKFSFQLESPVSEPPPGETSVEARGGAGGQRTVSGGFLASVWTLFKVTGR